MKNKRGFTLVELLAIIVILAIIAVITVPIILNIIGNSKKGSAADSAYGFKDAVQKYYLSESVNNPNQEAPTGTYNISDLPSTFLVSGDVPSDGWIKLEKGQVVDYSLKFGDYVVSFDLNTGNIVAEKNGDLKQTPRIVQVGDEVCYGPTGSQECFKVISTNASTTLLFANYNLKKDTTNNIYKQDASSPDLIIFSESMYWHDFNASLKSDYAKDVNGNSASYSGNPYPYVYNDTGNNVKSYVDGYVSGLKTVYGAPSTITGRLLTYEEASNTSIFSDNDVRKSNKTYWLGSVSGSGVRYGVNFATAVWTVSLVGTIEWESYDLNYGVRPVIIVPTSDL